MSLLLILSRYAKRVQRKQSIKQSDIINVLNKVTINSFMTEAVIILKPVHGFAEQINGLVFI